MAAPILESNLQCALCLQCVEYTGGIFGEVDVIIGEWGCWISIDKECAPCCTKECLGKKVPITT